jgi:hypothetical protein
MHLANDLTAAWRAVADQQEFAELQAKYWPEVTVIATLRQISTRLDAPGD